MYGAGINCDSLCIMAIFWYLFTLSLSLLSLLSSNSFSEIKEDAFSGLPHLEYL